MNMRTLTLQTLIYGSIVALTGLTGCIVHSGRGYDEGRRDEHRVEAERREAAHEHAAAREEAREEHHEREWYEHHCDDPAVRAHDDRCR